MSVNRTSETLQDQAELDISTKICSQVTLAGIDLSAAFDVADVELLIKQLTILGLPQDVVKLIKIWLNQWFLYVCVNCSESTIKVNVKIFSSMHEEC